MNDNDKLMGKKIDLAMLDEAALRKNSGANWWAYVIALLLLIIGALAGIIVAGGL